MEMRLRAPVTRGYFFFSVYLGALRLVNAASPRNIDQKKISSGTQGTFILDLYPALRVSILSSLKNDNLLGLSYSIANIKLLCKSLFSSVYFRSGNL